MQDTPSILKALTLEEKASLCSGADMWHTKAIQRLSIPPIMMADGPHGLRKQENPDDPLGVSVPATCFPTASALAASWNRNLLQEVGIALGEECLQERVSVLLGPGCNIKRSPLCGRNFEYFSEDPFLAGELAASFILGVQSKGIGTSLKHFAVNNQECRRMSIDARVDERALHELYLAGFEMAVRKAQPWTVMCAYNQLNGAFCCEHETLLTTILKQEWGHTGIVMTDWGAMNRRVEALQVGCELEMPGPRGSNDALMVNAVNDGTLSEAILDEAVGRLLGLIARAQKNLQSDFRYDADAHHELARFAATEGAVLLKNTGDLLPLGRNARIAVLGRFAKEPRFQGAGSSNINPTRLENAYEHMLRLHDGRLSYASGYSPRAETTDAAAIQEAVAYAREAEIAVVFAGLTDWDEIEGLDRSHLHLPPGHHALIEAVSAANPNTVVVLSNGAPVEMPWEPQVPAILEGYLGGQAGGRALAEILYGEVNPSGKLAETFPLHLEDTPSHAYFPGGPKTVEYRESLFVGYRFFDTAQKEVLFPFGHGLSYTHFSYHNLQLSSSTLQDGDTLTVQFTIRNDGGRAGAETAQLYVHDIESTAFRPMKELKGFEKVWLDAGEEQQITIRLDRRAFACYDPGAQAWLVEPGAFAILIGASSRDIRLSTTVTLTGAGQPSRALGGHHTYQYFPHDAAVSREDFAALLGSAPPPSDYLPGEAYTVNTSIADMRSSALGRLLGRVMARQIEALTQDDPDSPNAVLMRSAAAEAPLRIWMMANEDLSYALLEALVLLINGQVWAGLKALIAARKPVRR